MTDREQIADYLKNLPSEWAEKLTDLLVQIKCSQTQPTCAEVKECETLTSLSAFRVTGSQACITYKDEDGVSIERCFDAGDLINGLLDVDPDCLADETTWNSLTFKEKFQLLINSHCDCCD
jgi:hypothetical protein